ncbi:zinc finger protein ZPR1 [Leptopilina heterotoma]|uniref:zinc finger protein ZPR1 n=1 Tax=Leptopilina heterotoma TaxID=63436 RepID=UPI001CA869BD|nr:zinc finger protein ZPR1 [Leptopilina heterotoma]
MSKSEERSKNEKNPLFNELSAEGSESESTVIESLCMNCGKNGVTKLLLTKIPYYKDIVISSFACEHCGYQNNEIQNAGKITEKGIKITLTIVTNSDLNRQVVKSDYTSVRIPHLDFEIPAQSQKGEVTTVEGIIERSIAGLEQDQAKRKTENADIATQIEKFVEKLEILKECQEPYKIIFEDISGDCFVENPLMPLKDANCEITFFKRTLEQNHILGIYLENEDKLLKPIEEGEFPLEEIEGEVLTFPTNCPECNSPCETNMKVTNIPYFKEVVIMATTCDVCGHRTNEVKSGTGIEPQGAKIEVKITGRNDFSRDILKSDTCHMEIPELELEVGPTTFGGRFTTVEGIIISIKNQLSNSTAFIGDSSDRETVDRLDKFISQLEEILDSRKEVTLILDDPAGNSFIQSLSDDGPDDRMKITKYERTFEQNEELGINDLKVDNY